MPGALLDNWIEELGLGNRLAGEFLTSLAQIDSYASPGYAREMRRAWHDLTLSGIACADGKPLVYFKESSDDDPMDARLLHRRFWNHSLAPVLAVITATEVKVYSSLALPARPDQDADANDRLVDALQPLAVGMQIRDFVRSVETGHFFALHPDSFKPGSRVDGYLLANLKAARRALLGAEGLSIEEVHALLGRVVFTCYLVDRGVIGPSYFVDIGSPGAVNLEDLLSYGDADDGKARLYTLFQALQRDFNGDMFGGDLGGECERLREAHTKTIRHFLHGDDLRSGQRSLGFWPYDFKAIPIETISAIYESFLEAEDEEGRQATGAFYTPRFLAHLVTDLALGGRAGLLQMRFLDPACGSGVFLVGLFARLAEEWHRANPEAPYDTQARELAGVIERNLYGIDSSETACHIAAFSLYLALLDQLKPSDIQQLLVRGHILPKLVLGRNQAPGPDTGHTIICRDFGDQNLPVPQDGFDFVMGNPPWARRADSGLKEWCDEQHLPMPQNQLAYGFLWKAPRHLRAGGRVCFLIPTALLVNQQDLAWDFQEKWLTSFAVERIVNLADMSFWLFGDSARPASIVRYTRESPDLSAATVDYCVPKTEPEGIRAQILSISPSDRVRIRIREVLSGIRDGQGPLVWTQRLWGTSRDMRLLDRLLLLPPLGELVSTAKERTRKRWLIGQGFQPAVPSDYEHKDRRKRLKPRPWPEKTLFLDARSENISLVVTRDDCAPLGDRFPELRRVPSGTNADVFVAPHVVVTKGFRAAFCNTDAVFRHALHGIHGHKDDADLLRFLAGVMNSDLATYFYFHTASSWGTERDTVLESEFLRLPFPLPDCAPEPAEAHRIVRAVSKTLLDLEDRLGGHGLLDRAGEREAAKARIQPLIYRYYGIDDLEKVLIEDTVRFWEPSSTPHRGASRVPTWEASTPGDRGAYLDIVCAMLNDWSRGSGYRVVGGLVISRHAGLGVVTLSRRPLDSPPEMPAEQDSLRTLDTALLQIARTLPERQRSLSYLRDLKVFVGKDLFIVKPLACRFWTKTYALNDADEIGGAILRATR